MNSKSKLPGKGFRILSYIPVFNLIAVFHIGIINSNIAMICAAVVYTVLSFAFPDLGAFIWIVSIIHYSIYYRKIKKQTGQYTVKRSAQTKSQTELGTYSSSSNNGFSDIQMSGYRERTEAIQSIPRNAYPNITLSMSTRGSNNKFYADMRRYEHIEGNPARFTPFMTYWPTYDGMSKSQQAWYFYWRSQIRRGNCLTTDLSYIFVLIYELLSGVGWQEPSNGYEWLTYVWGAYREIFPSLDRALGEA